jgi:hypothetical protein
MYTRYCAEGPSEQVPLHEDSARLDAGTVTALRDWKASRHILKFRARAPFYPRMRFRVLYPLAAAPSDFITVLTAAEKSKVLTKRISLGADGNPVIRDYDDVKRFARFEKVAVGGLDDIAKVIDSAGSNTVAVIGEPTDAAVMGARRLMYDDPRTGDRATLAATKHCYLLIDIDSAPCPEGLDPIADPEAAVKHVVRHDLPPEMHDRDVYWQLTSGAGFKSGIRLRLCFWLDRPLWCKEMKEWVGGLDYVDGAIYTPNQPIYVAKPILAKGLTDPVPRRSGICRGTYRTVSPPDPILSPHPQPGGGGPKHNDFEGTANGAKGYAYWCKRIGDHADGEGFHEPIKKAIGSYVGANGTFNTELLRAQLVWCIGNRVAYGGARG